MQRIRRPIQYGQVILSHQVDNMNYFKNYPSLTFRIIRFLLSVVKIPEPCIRDLERLASRDLADGSSQREVSTINRSYAVERICGKKVQ
jgi:hypothetical protein